MDTFVRVNLFPDEDGVKNRKLEAGLYDRERKVIAIIF